MLEEFAQLVDRHDRGILFRLLGRRAEVRQRDDARLAEQRRDGKVGQIVLEPMRAQRGAHRRRVDDSIPREIEQRRTWPHRRQSALVDQVPRDVEQRHVQRDELRLLQQLLDAVRLAHARRQAPRRIDGDLGIEADHLHPEPDGGVGDEAADRAEPDDPQRAAGQLHAGKLSLALFDASLEVRRIPLERRHVADRGDHVARREQQRRQNELLDGVGIRARRVEHRDAARRHCRHGNVVRAGAGATDCAHARGDRHAVHVVRANQNAVRTLDLLADGVVRGRESMQAGGRNLVKHQDLKLAHPRRRSKSFM